MTDNVVDIKKEKYVVLMFGVLFSFLIRMQQAKEINRIFIRTESAGAIKFNIIYVFAFCVSVAFISFFIWGIFELGRWKREGYTQFFTFFFIYLFSQSIILLCIWPGNYRADEMMTLAYMIANLGVYWLQSFFSFLLMATSLMIMPYLAFITFFQLCIISIIAALIYLNIRNILVHKKLAYFLLFPFWFLPVLDNNQFIIRNSIISWLIIYMIIRCYSCYAQVGKFTSKCVCEVLAIAIFVGAWKTEMFCFLPVYVLMFLIGNKNNLEKKNICKVGIYMIVLFALFTMPSHFETNSNYITTVVVTPVTDIMVKHEQDYPAELSQDFETLSKFISVDEMAKREKIHGVNIPAVYWDKKVLSSEEKKEYMKAALRFISYYQGDFWANRLKVYRYTNGFVQNVVNQNHMASLRTDDFDLLTDHFRHTMIGNSGIRASVISFLNCRKVGEYNKTTWAFPFVYNTTPFIVAVLALFIYGIVRKKMIHFFLMGGLLVYFVAIFVLTPAFFFMYYLPLYLSGAVYLMMLLLLYIDKKINRDINEIKEVTIEE